jgi:hypothetical protein
MRKELYKLLNHYCGKANTVVTLQRVIETCRSELLQIAISEELETIENDEPFAHGCIFKCQPDSPEEQAVWDNCEFGSNVSEYVHDVMYRAEKKLNVLEDILTALEDVDFCDENGCAEVIINKNASRCEGFKLTIKE